MSLFLLLSTSAFSRGYYAIEPVRIIQEQSQVRLVYWLDCGSEFEGIVIQPKSGIRKIGILSKRAGERCLSMPERHETRLNQVLLSDGSDLISLNPLLENQRLLMLPTSQLLLEEREHANRLSISYVPQCNQGWIVLQAEGSLLKVGLLGYKRKTCGNQMLQASLLNIPQTFEATGLLKSEHAPQYRVFTSPIKTNSARRGPTGLTSFRYLRRCNEAPIGIIKKQGLLAIAVARYEDMECPKESFKVTWTNYETRLFTPETINRSHRLRSHRPITVLSPSQVTKLSSNSLSYKSAPTCSLHFGTVLRENQSTTQVAPAFMETQGPCKKSPVRLSLKLSGFKSLGQDLLGLRLKL